MKEPNDTFLWNKGTRILPTEYEHGIFKYDRNYEFSFLREGLKCRRERIYSDSDESESEESDEDDSESDREPSEEKEEKKRGKKVDVEFQEVIEKGKFQYFNKSEIVASSLYSN